MFHDFFKFQHGTEVEFTLSRNRMFDRLVLKGTIANYLRDPYYQTVRRDKEVKHYPVSLVCVRVEDGSTFTIDVDCIITKPNQAMLDKINERAEKAVKVMEKKEVKIPKATEVPAFKLGEVARQTLIWTYIASKNSKKFHNIDSSIAKRITTENAVRFKSKAEAKASGRTYAGK